MTLDLGALVGEVSLDATLFEATYVRVVRQMADLGTRAGAAAAGTSELDKSLAQAGASANAAAAGLGRADKALTEAGVSTSEAALASSKLTQAQLRQLAATERLAELQASETATTRQLAGAQASLIAANDRVALSEKRVDESMALGARSADKFRNTIAAIPGPVKAAALALAAVTGLSIEAARKFQDVTTRIGTQANASQAQVDALRAGILAMAGAVATAPDVLANAAYHIASVGQNSLTTAQQLQVLTIAAEGAKLGHANLVDVTNALDAAIVANMKGVRDYAQVMGVMNATVGAGDMNMQDFADAFGPLGSTFKGFGVSIQQAGAALATFGDNNIRGADAGTQLRMSITALADPLKSGQDQMKKWGLSSGNLSAQLAHGGLTEALTVLAAKLRENGVTADTMGPKLAQMFGKRGPQQGLSILINELDRYQGKLHEVTTGGDTFQARWADYTKTLSYAWDRISAGAEAAAIKIGNRLLPDATKALSWIGTTGVNDVTAFWHAVSTNTTVSGGFHDLGSALAHVVDALHNAEQAAEPLARVFLTLGGGAVFASFRLLATVMKDVAVAVDDVTGFFAHNKTAAEALGLILATLLVPAALAAGKALVWAGLEATAAGVLALFRGASSLAAGLRGLNVAALAARAAFAIVAVAVIGAVNDLMQGDQAIKQLRSDMAKPLPAGNVFEQVTKQINTDLAPAFSRLSSEGFNVGSAFLWITHPVRTFNDAIGTTGTNLDHLTQKTQGQILGNLHDLQSALYGLGANPIDAQRKLTMVIDAMGLSADQLATKNFPALLAKVQDWTTANNDAKSPAEQVHTDIVALGSGAQTAADDVNALTDALTLLAGNAISADQGAIAFKRDIAALDGALKKSHGSLSLNSKAGQDARDALDQAAQQAINLAEAEAKLPGGVGQARASLQASITALKDHTGNTGYAKKAIGELQAALDQLPHAAGKAATGLKAAGGTFKQAGEDAASGYATGITKGEVNAIHAAEQMGKLSAQAAKNAIQSSSPSKVFQAIGASVPQGYALGVKAGLPSVQAIGKDLAKSLGDGFSGYSGELTKVFKGSTLSALDATANQLQKAAAQYQTDVSNRTQMQSSVASSLLGAADISQLALSNTGGATIRGNNANLIATLTRESSDIARLRKLHLDPTYLQQITSGSPDRGVMLAEDILGGGEGSVGGLNKQLTQLRRLSGGIGTSVANASYAGAISRDEHRFDQMARALEHFVNKALDLSTATQQSLARALAQEITRQMPSLNIDRLDRALGIEIRGRR